MAFFATSADEANAQHGNVTVGKPPKGGCHVLKLGNERHEVRTVRVKVC